MANGSPQGLLIIKGCADLNSVQIMADENKEVIKNAEETANQNASTDETNKELENQADTTADQSDSVDKLKAELEQERLRREGAEKKIVEQKRKLKDAGIEENPDVNEVVEEALNKRLDTLKAIASANETKLLKENSELRETIKARQSTSNSSSGSNQVKPNMEEGLKLSARDREFMQRAGITEEDIKKNIASRKLTS